MKNLLTSVSNINYFHRDSNDATSKVKVPTGKVIQGKWRKGYTIEKKKKKRKLRGFWVVFPNVTKKKRSIIGIGKKST